MKKSIFILQYTTNDYDQQGFYSIKFWFNKPSPEVVSKALSDMSLSGYDLNIDNISKEILAGKTYENNQLVQSEIRLLQTNEGDIDIASY